MRDNRVFSALNLAFKAVSAGYPFARAVLCNRHFVPTYHYPKNILY
jgi:hypothetical protein